MANYHFIPVTTRREKRDFLNLPWRLHKQDPFWVPPLRSNQAELVGFKRHPFYDDAEAQTFLAYLDSEPCGRVSAILNHAHNRIHTEDQRGFLGFFESIDDQRVANGLFDAAREWFQARNIEEMRGPVNPSLNYECGLLVQNFEMPPSFMMTYNPAYYPRLWEEYGFKKVEDLFTFIGYKSHMELMEKKVQFVAEESAKRMNVVVRPVNMRNFRKDLETFLHIYNASLEGVWGHVPMSDAEVTHTANSLRYLIEPQLTLIAEIDGKPVGSMIGLIDYNPRIKEMDGRLFPFGFLKLLRNRKQLKRVRLISTNVLPEYQRWGVGVILAAKMLEPAIEYGMEFGEFSWVLESNHLSRRTLEKAKMAVEKLHRIYDFPGVDPAAAPDAGSA